MKTKLTLLTFFLGIFIGFSQNPGILWQNTIGSDENDPLTSFGATADGGTIMAGYTRSDISGDKTENSKGGIDIWIVKTDSSGNIDWQKSLGGSSHESFPSIIQTSEGGYILAAASDSNISGDKTDNKIGSDDYWIVKLDASGNIAWQKTYGGTGSDSNPHIIQTANGGYFVGGTSKSVVSGDKTEPRKGVQDYWVLKLDSTGNIIWQKSLGGSAEQNLNDVLQTADGGFILTGQSTSDAGGDKSENSQGADFWIVKLNASGIIEWENTIGGNKSDIPNSTIATSDGNYLITGSSNSDISGDKTEANFYALDYWILKIDPTGNILWQKTIGGANVDTGSHAIELNDGSYLIAGDSNSNTSGNKTDDIHIVYDYWLVRLDVSGNILSQVSIGGNGYEGGYPYNHLAFIALAADGNYLMACNSDSNISGDKTQDSKGGMDYWVFKSSSSVLGLEQNSSKATFRVYPNPNSGEFTIDLGKEYSEVSLQIYNVLGQIISSEKYDSIKTIHQEITGEEGVYFVKINSTHAGSKTLKVLKQ